jgi:uncharacterized protein (DUF2235 family)
MKNILLFADGTSENSHGGEDNIKTNIAKIFELAINDENQHTHYHYGVGSKNNPLVKYVQRAVGYGLRDNMMKLYKHLTEVYEEGDEIYLFGFSRGAYTVRSLVGLINMVGIVQGATMKTSISSKTSIAYHQSFASCIPSMIRSKNSPLSTLA